MLDQKPFPDGGDDCAGCLVFFFPYLSTHASKLGIEGGFWDYGVGNIDSFENVGTRSGQFINVGMKFFLDSDNSHVI